jgi:hypothetical protein
LQCKMLVFFMAILSILRPNCISYGHLEYFKSLEYFSRFGILDRGKSGNRSQFLVHYVKVPCYVFAFIRALCAKIIFANRTDSWMVKNCWICPCCRRLKLQTNPYYQRPTVNKSENEERKMKACFDVPKK